MESYVSICGKKIELTPEQVEKLWEILGGAKVKLATLAVEDTFKIGPHEFVVLEQSGDTTAVIRRETFAKDMAFGKNNNYNGSDVDHACNDFAEELAALVGRENLVEHTVDLTSDDGLKDYGKIRRRASLLATDRYRRYVEILDKYPVDKWLWLSTPFSTARHGYPASVKCVSPRGYLYFNIYDGDGVVRPFCILKSNIFVSK